MSGRRRNGKCGIALAGGRDTLGRNNASAPSATSTGSWYIAKARAERGEATLEESANRLGVSKMTVVRLGDGLVPVASALGRHKDRARALEFPADRQWVACETGHLDLLSRSNVYEQVARWLAGTSVRRSSAPRKRRADDP